MGIIFQVGEEKKDGEVSVENWWGWREKGKKGQKLSRGRLEALVLVGRNLQDVREEASFWSRLIHMRCVTRGITWSATIGLAGNHRTLEDKSALNG